MKKVSTYYCAVLSLANVGLVAEAFILFWTMVAYAMPYISIVNNMTLQ